MTLRPFLARRRETIGPSSPTAEDTPRRLHASETDRVCHSRLERSAAKRIVSK